MVSEAKASRVDGQEITGGRRWEGRRGTEEDRVHDEEDRDCRPCSNTVTNHRRRQRQVASATVCVAAIFQRSSKHTGDNLCIVYFIEEN